MADQEERQEQQQLEDDSGGLRGNLSSMSMGKKLSVLAAAALIIGGFVSLLLWINTPDYQVLFSGLEQQDASQVVAKLKDLKVPYEIDGGGSIIKVPGDQVYEARLSLASEGLPRGGAVGFEVFNEVKMGTTEFVQKINYQRALQGELARTITGFSEVQRARVHLVMPRESLFVEDKKRPTAAVVVDLAAGRTLSKSQIQGIVHLVASSVPDLTDADVTVVDNRGNLLFRKEADTAGFPAAQTASQLEYKKNVENTVKAKVQSMLEQVLGQGRAVVRVAAEIDFTSTATVQELYDPDQVAVRSETRSTENNQNAGPGPVGAPDQRFALATRNATPGEAGGDNQSQSNRENETTNFEISRTRKQMNQAIGGLKRLNVAVVVDGPYSETTSAEGATTRTFTPRSAEEMRQIGDLVKSAAGVDDNRGDQVTVANVPFALPTEMGTLAETTWQDYLKEYGRPVLNLVLALLFFFIVARPVLKYLSSKRETVESPMGGPGMVAVGPGEELPPGEGEDSEAELLEAMSGPKKMSTRDVIMALAQQDPEKTTAVLRSWIHEA